MSSNEFNVELHSRFLDVTKTLRKKLSKIKQNNQKKKKEVEICWKVNAIRKYGFVFEPEHYVLPLVVELEEIAQQLS